MKRLYIIMCVVALIVSSCDLRLSAFDADDDKPKVVVERYDRLQSLYLTTGDFTAMQQMYTEYPMQTRALIEDVLKIGHVNDPEINSKFLRFYQDTVLQALINEVEQQYAKVDDIDDGLTEAFRRLVKEVPDVPMPQVYTQIGTLDQSIVVGNTSIGICLDKYLGRDYPLYARYYSENQRAEMERSMIVPDCMVFYILSLYPMPHQREYSDLHIGKIMWVVNKVTDRHVFRSEFVDIVDHYMRHNKDCTIARLLESRDYKALMSK